ncbi:MAG TPA: histidine kinase [Burkholderiales bacterium]|nr:histidine kinase [Burkholderiales bacterium]
MSPPPTPREPDTGFATTQAPTGWGHSTRPLDTRGTAFGSTLLDLPLQAPGGAGAPQAFDACHVGVVLRAVVFVNGVVAVGVMFAARDLASWAALVTVGASVALPGVLLWLMAACLLKRWLSALPVAAQWAAALALGAASGGFGWAIGGSPGLVAGDLGHAPAALLAGAGLAAAVFQWLRMRAKAKLPADTTARLAELQSRIRPHFLFNTLNTALSLVTVDPARAEIVLEDLAELFRVALTDSGESVSLGEEVELAQRYLAIEQMRFGDRLRVQWELDADAGRARVPPLLLQPLVENAVRHGVEPAPDGGVVRVRTRVRMGRVLVSITNTVPDTPSRPGNGIALENVRERLRLMHDVAAQLDTRLERDVFRVQLVVPLER